MRLIRNFDKINQIAEVAEGRAGQARGGILVADHRAQTGHTNAGATHLAVKWVSNTPNIRIW